ncbi:MAG: CvpA family protein [Lysobacterales bacterium]|jgi:membrane protein required for colicin V production
MNWTDCIILGVLALSVLIGLFRGLIAEVLSLVIWIAAFWVTWAFGPVVSAHLEHTISMPSLRYSIGYGLCFVVVLILGALVRFLVRRLIWSAGLSGIDRLFGMVFGFARGILIVTLLVFLVGLTAFTRDSWWQKSVLLPQFQQAAAWLGQNMPADVSASVREHFHPSAVLDRIRPSDVLDKLHGLPASMHAPTSGTTPAAAASAHPTPPATASSAATHFQNF